MNVYEMEGFLRGKCMPRDILVNESTAEYLVRKLNEATAVKAERDALAVENAALKDAITTHSQSTHFCELCGKDDPCSTDDVCYALNETPATDAAVAAIKARGAVAAIENLISRKERALAEMHPDTHAYGATQATVRNQIYDLELFAAELREGK